MRKLCLLFLLIGTYCYAGEKKYTVDSPDGKIQLAIIQTDAGELTYQLSVKRKQVIDASALGFKTEDGLTFPFRGWKMGKVTRNKVNSVWKPLWGKRAVVPDKYNEMKLSFVNEAKSSDALEVVARAYNEGVAFRYVSPQGAGSALELTTFNFAGDYTAWFYNGERHNIGPERLTETDGERLPVMTVKAADDLYLAVHEACLDEGEPLKLKSEKGQCLFSVSVKPHLLHAGYQSAWRVVLCGNRPGDLVDSHLLELLNPEPSGDYDFSWVKPGVALWDWRINGAQWEGFHYTMSYPSWERMVDFAAEQVVGAKPHQVVAKIVERAFVLGVIGGGKPIPHHHISLVFGDGFDHFRGRFRRVGIVAVHHDIGFGVNFAEHAADDVAFTLLVFVAHHGTSCAGQLCRAIGRVVIVHIDRSFRQNAAEIHHNLLYCLRFVITGDKNCYFIQ